MPTFTLAEDVTGTNPDNFISSDPVALPVERVFRNQRVIIAQYGAYFDNATFRLYHVAGDGTNTLLVKDVDYYHTLEFRDASYALQRKLYGGVVITRDDLSGGIRMEANYLGGNWVFDNVAYTEILERLIERSLGSKSVYLEEVTGWPEAFPPGPHGHPEDDIAGINDIVSELASIASAIASRPPSATPADLTAWNTAIQAQLTTVVDRLNNLDTSGTTVGDQISDLLTRVGTLESEHLNQDNVQLTFSDLGAGRIGSIVLIDESAIGNIILLPDPSIYTKDVSWTLRKTFSAAGTYDIQSPGPVIQAKKEGDPASVFSATQWTIDVDDDIRLTFDHSENRFILKRI